MSLVDLRRGRTETADTIREDCLPGGAHQSLWDRWTAKYRGGGEILDATRRAGTH